MSGKCSIWARYFFLNSLLLLEKPRMHEKCFEFCFVDKRSVCCFSPRRPLVPILQEPITGPRLGLGEQALCIWFALRPSEAVKSRGMMQKGPG